MSDAEQEIVNELEPDAELAPDDETPEPEPEPDTEPAPAPPAGVTPEEMEGRYKSIDRAAKTYATRVASIMEEQVSDLLPCPLCATGGTPAFVNVHDAGRVPDPVILATQSFLGISREIEYSPDPKVGTCETCGGEGKTSTGSHVPEKRTRTCPTCNGFGYTPPPGSPSNGYASGETIVSSVDASELTAATEDRDVWGDPKILPDGRENPNFGRMPQYKVAIEPWGTTANLTAQDNPQGVTA